MFVLLFKEEGRETTSLGFVGCYASKEDAQRHVDRRFGLLTASGLGNYRMLEACGSTPAKLVMATEVVADLGEGRKSYVLAEY